MWCMVKPPTPFVWMTSTLLNVGLCVCSPPCQPWSTVGAEAGLSAEDGRLFSKVLEGAGHCRIVALLAEHVPAISRRRDFPTLVAGAQMDGMKLVC